MEKIHVGCDFNGVIADTWGSLLRFLEEETGALLPRNRYHHRTDIIGELLPSRRGGTCRIELAAYEKYANEFYGTDVFCQYVEPFQNSISAIKHILAEKHSFRIVSKIRSVPEECIWAWLESRQLTRTSLSVILTRNGDKTEFYRKCHVAIDDQVENLDPVLSGDWVKTQALLMLSPRNVHHERLHDPKLPPITQVRNWDEILSIIHDIHTPALRRAA